MLLQRYFTGNGQGENQNTEGKIYSNYKLQGNIEIYEVLRLQFLTEKEELYIYFTC